MRSDVSFAPLTLAAYPGGSLEVLSLSLLTNSASCLDVLSLYNPVAAISEPEFSHYFQQLGQNKLILGD